MLGFKSAAILLSLATAAFAKVSPPLHYDGLTRRSHFRRAAACPDCGKDGLGVGVGVGADGLGLGLGVSVGLGGGQTGSSAPVPVSTSVPSSTVTVDAKVKAAINAAVSACQPHVKTIVEGCKDGSDATELAATIKVEVAAIAKIVLALKVQLEGFVKAGFKDDASLFVAELKAFLSIFASIIIAVSGCGSFVVLIKLCASILVDFEAAIVACLNVLIGCLDGCVSVCAKICVDLGLDASLLTKCGLTVFAKLVLNVAVNVGGSADLALKFQAATQLAAHGCEAHVVKIVALCGGKVTDVTKLAADITIEIKACIALLVTLKAQLDVLVKAGFKGSAADFLAEIKLILSVFARICIAITGCASSTVLIKACASVVLDLQASIVACITVLTGCLSGCVDVCVKICGDLGLTVDICGKLGLAVFDKLVFNVVITVAADLEAKFRAALTLAIQGCEAHVATVVSLCQGNVLGLVDLSAKLKVEIAACAKIFVDLKAELDVLVKAGFKAEASKFTAELTALLKAFASICVAVHGQIQIGALLDLVLSILLDLEAGFCGLIQLFVGCLHGFLPLCLSVFASVGLTVETCVALKLKTVAHLVFGSCGCP